MTCLAIDYTGTLLVSGSMDTTCMIWQIYQEYGSSVNLDPTPMHILYGHDDCVTSVDISIEQDMVVSASIDGTVNIHTIRKGDFVKSISFWNDRIFSFNNLNVKISNERHILVYTSGIGWSLNMQTKKKIYELNLFTINGKLISREQLSNPVQDMIIKDDYCILAVLVNRQTQNNSMNNSANKSLNDSDLKPGTSFVPASKIIFKEIYE